MPRFHFSTNENNANNIIVLGRVIENTCIKHFQLKNIQKYKVHQCVSKWTDLLSAKIFQEFSFHRVSEVFQLAEINMLIGSR